MAVYPGDLEHPRTHVVWVRTIKVGTGKVVLVAAYKTYPAMPNEGGIPRNRVEASITVSTYQYADSTNYSGALFAEGTYTHSNMAQAEVAAIDWLNGLYRDADWGAK
jgi:hypothetical protein